VSKPTELRLATIVSAPFGENSYIAHFEGQTDCLIFDPGLEPEAIVDYVETEGLVPAALVITHGHSDHIGGNAALKRRWPKVPLVIGRGDAPKLTDARLNLSAMYGMTLISPPADVLLDDGEIYRAAGFELETLEIPGHSSGHVVFVWRGARPWVVFGGDVLFRGSVGRTDFPDGSFESLAAGIHKKLFTLPDDTVVLPGHGEPTTIGEEKRANPFVGRPAGWRG
jgi:hydroxyacylglutathione hydrolase